MGKSNSNLLFLAIGAAIGAAAGYVAASDKKEEWMNEIGKLVVKVKKNVKGEASKADDELEDLIEEDGQ